MQPATVPDRRELCIPLPSSDPHRSVELVVIRESGRPGGDREAAGGDRPAVLLRELSYGQGIGWYPQRTMELSADEVDALVGALCCARQELRRGAAPCPGARPASAPSGATPQIVTIDSLRRR